MHTVGPAFTKYSIILSSQGRSCCYFSYKYKYINDGCSHQGASQEPAIAEGVDVSPHPFLAGVRKRNGRTGRSVRNIPELWFSPGC